MVEPIPTSKCGLLMLCANSVEAEARAAAAVISGRQIRVVCAMLKWDIADLQKRSSVDAGVVRRTENVNGTSSIMVVQAGFIQKQTFKRAGLRFGRGGGVLMAVGNEEP